MSRFIPSVAVVLWLSGLCLVVQPVSASVTFYAIPYVSIPGAPSVSATTVNASFYANLSAYNNIKLDAPGAPDITKQFTIQLQNGNNVQRLSLPQRGNFLGFSIELSVADQLLGKNSSLINVPFLNYLGNLRARSRVGARVRVGGNSQEDSTIHENDTSFDTLGKLILKSPNTNPRVPTKTPVIDYSDDLLYTMSNISSLVSTSWYFGLAFGNMTRFPNAVTAASATTRILGPHLLALQLSNEPDLYGVDDRRRTGPYLVGDLIKEWKQALGLLEGNAEAESVKDLLLGPSICCNSDGNWGIDDVIPTFVKSFPEELKVVSVQHYPHNNCHGGSGQDIFAEYLSHNSAVNSVQPYLQSAALAQASGKEFVMFETNTASCGGFAGLSDSFGAALWGVDYALQMAYGNFTGALWHFGGQNAAYSPFTPPPGKTRRYNQWTTGSVYYSTLAVTEALGSSNKSRVVDLNANDGNEFTPAYAIYEDNQPVRVVLINFINDPSGAHDLNVKLALPQGSPIDSVSVRYLLSPGKSVSDKTNFTWAGQTLGDRFQSDGRLYGDVVTTPVPCDATSLTCQVHLPASSMALIFLSATSLSSSTPTPSELATATFSTTVLPEGKILHTATVPQAVLATSNGRGGMGQGSGPPNGWFGSTSMQDLDSGAVAIRGSVNMVFGGLVIALVGAVVGLGGAW